MKLPNLKVLQHKIEWTGATCNVMAGCEKVSEGCKNCYAIKSAARVERFGIAPHYAGVTTPDGKNWSGKIAIAPEHTFKKLGAYRAGTMVFVNSMTDFFHPNAPDAVRNRALAIIASRPDVTYQILTKRPEHALPFLERTGGAIPDNAWIGTTIECSTRVARQDLLRAIPAKVRFLSAEPLLDDVVEGGLRLDGISWVIAGGESGPGARPMHSHWVRRIRDLCLAREVPFFFKQWGHARNNPLFYDAAGTPRTRTAFKQLESESKGGSLLDGRLWRELPKGMEGCDE